MTLPTEPIGSIPRPQALQDGMQAAAAGRISQGELDALFDDAVQDTLRRFDETGSPVVTDGEQRKPSFATYPIAGLTNLAAGGVTIPFEDGHTRQLPAPHGRSVQIRDEGVVVPRCGPGADDRPAQAGSHLGVGAQPAVSARMGSPGIPREAFLDDLVAEAASEIRGCIERGAIVQIDFTEARLSLKLDPSKALLDSFVDLNNRVLGQLTDEERGRVGVHTCPGGDQDSTHSADIDYEELLPGLFRMNVDTFYVQLASESGSRARAQDPRRSCDREPQDLRRRDRPDRPARRDTGRRFVTGCSRRHGSSSRAIWGRRTTAASRRSAMTRPRRATPRSPRSRRGSPGLRWHRANSGSEPGARRRPGGVAVRRYAERYRSLPTRPLFAYDEMSIRKPSTTKNHPMPVTPAIGA